MTKRELKRWKKRHEEEQTGFFFNDTFDELLDRYNESGYDLSERIPNSQMVIVLPHGIKNTSKIGVIDFPALWMRDKFIAHQTNKCLNKVWHISAKQRQSILSSQNRKAGVQNVIEEIINNGIFSMIEIHTYNMMIIKPSYHAHVSGIVDFTDHAEESSELNFDITYSVA